MSRATAPAGWGYRPGMPLGELTAQELPELPMLRFLAARRRNAAIVAALSALPFLPRVTASMVAERYDLSYTAAYKALAAARAGTGTWYATQRDLRAAA